MVQTMTARPPAQERLTVQDFAPVAPLIDGKSVESQSDERFVTRDPATGRTLLEVPRGSRADADLAVRAARASFDTGVWRTMAPGHKKAILLAWADLIDAWSTHIDALDALEMGKPISLQAFSASVAAGFLRFNAEAIDKSTGDVLASDSLSLVVQTRTPRGVVAAITPWNFPAYNCILKLAPALAAGNSVVLKPSEFSAQSALLLVKLALEAGVPPGVLNIVPGCGDPVGRALAEHMGVNMVTFTGSSEVGKKIMQYAGVSNMKVVGAECGGKSPQIVFDDGMDADLIAAHIARTIVTNQGQVCSFGSRILVQETLQDELVEKIYAHLGDIVVGDPQLPSTTYGPLVSATQYQKVMRFIADAQAQGGELTYGGKAILQETGGYFIEPTIFTKVASDSRIAREEVFGPVVAVLPFKDEDEAIRLANSTAYGLAAYIWSARVSTGHRLANSLQTAVTMVNADAVMGGGAGYGFSGEPAGLSGIGVEGGLAGFEAYQRRQTIWFNHG